MTKQRKIVFWRVLNRRIINIYHFKLLIVSEEYKTSFLLPSWMVNQYESRCFHVWLLVHKHNNVVQLTQRAFQAERSLDCHWRAELCSLVLRCLLISELQPLGWHLGGSMNILITIMLEYSNCTLCRQYYGAYIGFVVLWYVKRLYFSSTYIPAEWELQMGLWVVSPWV